jgi:UDP-2-acetamido-2-deoxy-ribo-hexuluronate aminotransferase
VKKFNKSIILLLSVNPNIFSTRSKSIVDVAKSTNSIIIEDCAQSTGLEKMPESYVAIHSFYPTKPLGCRGDGGAILTNDKHFADHCKKSRFYGLSDNLVKDWGFNSRMDEWQSSFLIEKLKYFRMMNEKRRENAKKYLELGSSISYSSDCVFHQYVDLFFDRSIVIDRLNSLGIPTMIHYPKMLCDMPFLLDKVKFIKCKRVADHVLSFPVGPHLSFNDVKSISNSMITVTDRRINFEEIL